MSLLWSFAVFDSAGYKDFAPTALGRFRVVRVFRSSILLVAPPSDFMPLNPKRITSFSPGLLGTSYPGYPPKNFQS